MSKPLWMSLYYEPVYAETARLIGYAGCSPFDFWDRAKDLKEAHGQQKIMNAVYLLTRADRREASPPRYELTVAARQCCFMLLGPAPEHPLHGKLNYGPPLPRSWDNESTEPPKPEAKNRTNKRKK